MKLKLIFALGFIFVVSLQVKAGPKPTKTESAIIKENVRKNRYAVPKLLRKADKNLITKNRPFDGRFFILFFLPKQLFVN
ncbi:MAG TPA: hypothetical protein VGE63_01320 [Candidatus Paceibacterota bacterium]